MKSDNNPSLILGMYCKPKSYNRFLKDCDDLGIAVREIRFVDVSIPLDKKYNLVMNWLKEFIYLDYWRNRNILNKIPFVDAVFSKFGFHKVKINKEWKNRKQHPLLFTLPCPLLVQDVSMHCTTDEERNNMKKLLKFESDGYEDDEDLIKKEVEKDLEDLEK